ncbi:MAG: alpha/beta fold hydrolase [Prevotella sp.]|nr:alpha/beta fold hydrolase [Prevotella sp.]
MKWKLLFVLWMAVAVSAQAQAPQADADAKYATELLKAGTQAPDFRMKTLDGKNFRFAKQTKGKYVLLDFWASWCPDCRKDIPNVQRMYEKFCPQGVEFIGVSMDTDRDKWKDAVEKYGIRYTQVSELVKFHDTQIASLYGVKWIPSMYLIDPQGKVVLATVMADKMERTLTELFAPKGKTFGTQESVSIDGAKGRLAAIIQKPVLQQGEQCPMVVLCHGFGGRKEGPLFEVIADSLANHGIASIRFDFNGHGESEGDFQQMTVPNEIEDARKVIEYVSDLRYVKSIAIAGHSQGGVVAAMTAGELGSEDIAAVALLAPAAVLRDDAIRGTVMGIPQQGDPADPPEYIDLWGKKLGRDYILTAQRLPIYRTAVRYHGPALIVHGTADRVVPYTYGERFNDIWAGSEYVELDGFDHGFSQNVYRACDIVSSWFIKTLQGR